MSPNEGELPENHQRIIKKHEEKYSKIKKSKRVKFSVGDLCRFSKLKTKFTRSYLPQSQHEILRVSKIFTHLPRVLYQMTSLSGDEIIGKFYEQELTLVKKQDEFLIEKVLKKKGKKILVKWLGYGPEHNSWIESKSVTSIKDIQDTE